MIEIAISSDGKPSKDSIVLGNKYENNDEVIHFTIPEKFESYIKYVIAVRKDIDTVTKIFPIIDSTLIVSSDLTYLSGMWYLYMMCREHELDFENLDIDISAKDGEHIFIADGFIGVVKGSKLDKGVIDNTPMDTNIKIVYDELVKLKDDLEDVVAGSVSWEQILNKPAEFPPTVHNHNDMYYTEEEIDKKFEDIPTDEIESISNEEIETLFRARGWRLV